MISPLFASETLSPEDIVAGVGVSGGLPVATDTLSPAGFQKMKVTLSPAEKKFSTDLLEILDPSLLPPGQTLSGHISKMQGVNQFSAGNQGRGTPGEIAYAGSVHVYVWLREGVPTSVVDPYAGMVTGRDEEWGYVSAWVPVSRLTSLAELPAVRQIVTVQPPGMEVNQVTTEGDVVLKADLVRALTYGKDGTGIKVGIISDGVDNITESLAGVTVRSNVKGGNEGTAMLEIVNDLAPGASLYFHDCGNSTALFNQAVTDLADQGCRIICDDIVWFNEPCFQDGPVATHVEQIRSTRNVLYITSTGNNADKHYQANFTSQPGNFSQYHDFSKGSNNLRNFYVKMLPNSTISVFLQWNDEWGLSANDYDLFLEDNADGSLLAQSTGWQTGNQNPYEWVSTNNNGPEKWVQVRVKKESGDPRMIEVYIKGKNIQLHQGNLLGDGPTSSDSVFGHKAVPGVVSVAAIDAADPGHDNTESYSSKGPVTICWPLNESRHKPDITGIDGVRISGAGGFGTTPKDIGEGSPVFKRFYGTSAAAPHIAALAALLWSKDPSKTPEAIKAALFGGAVDLGSAGRDDTTGYGRADALASYQSIYSPEGVPGPIALFHGSPRTGSRPLTVVFRDDSTGKGIDTWDWDFGDGTSHSSVKNPTHTYQFPGKYTVTLTVTSPYGSTTRTESSYITLTGGLAPGEYLWEGDSLHPPDGTQIRYSLGPTIMDLPQDESGGWYYREHNGILNGGILFTGNLTGIGTSSSFLRLVAWYPEDHVPQMEVLLDNVPLAWGPFNVLAPGIDPDATSLKYRIRLVTDAGSDDTLEVFGDLIGLPFVSTPPIADFSADETEGSGHLVVSFTDQSIGQGITSWDWNFGDGTPNETSKNPKHNYTTHLSHDVTLTVRNANGNGTLTMFKYITVQPPPVAAFSGAPLAGDVQHVVSFIDESTGADINDWYWTFGDGGTSTDQNSHHLYQLQGTYTVSLKVTDAYGTTSTETKTGYVTVDAPPPAPPGDPPAPGPLLVPFAAFNAAPRNGTAPLAVNFTDESTGFGIIERRWTFGDGNTTSFATSENPLHVYQAAGNYTVVLGVRNASGWGNEVKGSFIKVSPGSPFPLFIGSINPASTLAGSPQFTLTVNGQNFTSQSKLQWNGANKTTTFKSAGQVTATIPAGDIASPGSASVRIVDPSRGLSNAVSFIITDPPVPVVLGVQPGSGVKNTVVTVSNLSGQNFRAGDTVILARAGQILIPGTSVVVTPPGKIACKVNLSGAQTGAWDVVVTDPGGKNGTLPGGFMVTLLPPTVSSVSPTSGTRNSTVAFTVSGTKFASGVVVNFTNKTYTALDGSWNLTASITSFTPTKLAGTVTFPLDAPVGKWDIVVTNPDMAAVSKSGAFTVTNPVPPTVGSVTPKSGSWNSTVPFTLSGTKFASGAVVNFTNKTYTALDGSRNLTASITSFTPTKLAGTVTFPLDAPVGKWDIVVTNPDTAAVPKAGAFTVTNPVSPIISSVFPTSGTRNTVVAFTLSGTNFRSGAIVNFTNETYLPGNLTTTICSVTPTKIKGNLTLLPGIPSGKWSIVLTNPDVAPVTKTRAFTVNP